MHTTNPEEAITELCQAMATAWNRADSEAFGELFADDVDFVEARGGHHVGRPAVEQGHQDLWDSIYAGSTVQYRLETVRPLGEGVAVGLIAATLEAPIGPLAGTNHARITVVVRDGGDRWRIVSFQNTLVQAQPAAT